MKHTVEVLYDGCWVADVTIDTESEKTALDAVYEDAINNIEVKIKEGEEDER